MSPGAVCRPCRNHGAFVDLHAIGAPDSRSMCAQAAVAAARAKCRLLCREAGTRRALRRQLVKAVDARRGKESRANGLLRELLSELRELDGIGSPEPCTPFSPKRMNLRGAVRVPLPPSEIDRVGAELSEMRGGLSRRDVGVALVVAGLGALTLAATVVGA